jgi:hypothetical protein
VRVVFTVIAVFVAVLACRCASVATRPTPSATEPRDVPLSLVAMLDEAYPHLDLSLAGPDGGAVWERQIDTTDGGAPGGSYSARGWYRGAGSYALRVGFRRADGGEGIEAAALQFEGNELRVEAWVTLFDQMIRPDVSIQVAEEPPAGLRLAPVSSVSPSGQIRYEISNSTPWAFRYLNGPHLERREGSAWGRVTHGLRTECDELQSDRWLDAAERQSSDVGSSICLVDALEPGRYRYFFWMMSERHPAGSQVSPVQIARIVELDHEFDILPDAEEVPSHLLTTIPVADLRADWDHALGNLQVFLGRKSPGEIAISVVAPNGERACVCPGLYVGKERLRVSAQARGPCLNHDDGGSSDCELIPPLTPEAYKRLRRHADAESREP